MRTIEPRDNELPHVPWAVRWAVPAALAAVVILIPLLSVGDETVKPGLLPALRGRTAPTAAGITPLLDVIEEQVSCLAEAKDMIDKGDFDQAIYRLQNLIQLEECGFYAESDSRFVSMRLKAQEMIGSMGPKGLKLYRTLYDPPAHQLYENAIASASPDRPLRRLSERYLHTTYGPQALEMLGSLNFDRARFSQAAVCWRQLLPLAAEGAPRGALLAKILAAHHLAGETALADQAADELGKKYAGVTAMLGGQERKLAEFAAQVRAMPAAAVVEAVAQERKDWPGLGGVPTGLATMSDCDIVLAPRWPQDAQGISSTENLVGKLKVGGGMFSLSQANGNQFMGNHPNNVQRSVNLKNGQLFFKGANQSNPDGEVLPGLLHPVVAGDLVIVRLDDKVAAFDLLTGASKWESMPMGMVRKMEANPNANMFFGGTWQYIGDTGRYGLTVGGGMIFTVYDFLPTGGNIGFMRMQNPNIKNADDSSILAAVSLKDEGKLQWRRGRGQGDRAQGDKDILAGCIYLCPPTYRDGRLYAMVLYLERYYVVCLEAATGTTIWQSAIAQAPALNPQNGGMPAGLDPRLSVGSPPAVADGRVYATTNSGVVAALDEETGQPLWGYQYVSKVNTANNAGMQYIPNTQYAVYRPGNPLIVSRRRVICLPADSDALLALDADSGQVAWTRTRRSQNDLSAIDADRVLLSGKGLFVMRVADGEQLNQGPEDMGVYGRPAVTAHQVLASALGKVEIMDLKTYATSNKDLSSPDAVLGNLVSVDGKLISASMMGPYAYFSYDVARNELTKRMDAAPRDKHPEMLRQRARLSMDARKFDKALEDIQAAEKLAKEGNDAATLALLGEMYYSTYVGLGNHATSDQGMKQMFDQAVAHASSKQERGHMKLRMALYEERVGHYERAAELAQELADNFGQEELVEVEIGPNAPDRVRFGVKDSTLAGEKLAKDYIKGLIEKYGRNCYAKFDALAKEALNQAEAEGDPARILAVEKTWPNSEWADDSLFRGAEAYYLLALDLNAKAAGTADKASAAECGTKADDYLAEARRLLYRVSRLSDSPFRVSASMGLATIYARGGWVTSAHKECGALHELDGKTDVAFANVKGKLAEVLKAIEGGDLTGAVRYMKLISRIDTPLAEIYSVKGENVTILRDQEYRPVRIGERIAVVKDSDVYLMETAAGSEAEALAGWKGLAALDKTDLVQYSYFPPGMRLLGGLSKDQKTLVVADRKTIRGLDVVSAKVSWEVRMQNIGIPSFYCMAIGDGVLLVVDQGGNLVCVDLATGKEKGKNVLVGGSRTPIGPPQIAGQIAVIRYDGGRKVACFDLSKDCRLVGKWSANQWTNTEITEDGLLVMLLDDELSVREPSNINKPLWTAKYDMNRDPSILAVSSEMVAISPSNMSGKIEVYSVSGGGRKLATFETAQSSGQQAVPLDAQFDGDVLYVLAAPGMGGRRKGNFGRQSASRGMNLQKFTVSDGKRRWDCELENMAMFYPNILPIVVGQKSVVVSARHFQIGMACHTYVVDGETGKISQKIDMRGGAAGVKDEARRRQAIGQPVMTDGRLCVENVEGVTVYGKQ